MRLTAFTDFGFRILMRLAGAPTQSFTTEEIATEFQISRNHLAKVVHDLSKAGYIKTRRGAGGGFRLVSPPQSITLGDVVRSLEQRHALVDCFRSDGGSCVLTPHCLLRSRLAAAREAFLRELDMTTLAQCVYPATPQLAVSPRAAACPAPH
jgi:Rrf2 family nitric oxide-sensitive transcriptional repressor